MHLIYLAARTYPYWAIPLAFVVWQLGIFFFHRRMKVRFLAWAVIGFIVVTAIAWAFFRGDLYAEDWVRFLCE